ncbi:MAG: hypothetical protein FWE21_07990 [Defluviitaleaceae bacterium]|nr:hypothetical protein [Defluviitaleaceae bacterium]
MSKKIRSFVALLLAFVMAVPMIVMGNPNIVEADVRLFIDGAEVSVGERGNNPFNVNGTVFLPIRALTTAFSRDAHWEPSTNTLYFGERANAAATNVLTIGGHQITLEQVEVLGITPFTANDRGNDRSFAGVPLADIFAFMGIEFSGVENFAFVAADGMATTATTEEILNPANGWLVLSENGERFTAREDGGRGPFMVVFAEDGVPGRWARMLTEIIPLDELGQAIPFNADTFADGTAVDFVDGAGNAVTPFVLDGVIYLPVRALSIAMGMTVNWNAAENAIYVGTAPQTFEAAQGGEFTVNAGGMRHIVTMEDILEIGIVETYAVIRGERRDYTGVPISAIMEFLGLDVSGVTAQITFGTRDGHGTAGTPDEVFDPTNGFVVIAENGELLGHWEAGGRGPFMLVFAQDVFAQRFMRYLTDINIEGAVATNVVADSRWTSHQLNFLIGDLSLNLTAGDIYALGATPLEWNEQNFTAVSMATIAEHFGLGEVISGRIVADNGTERDFVSIDAIGMYIAIYQSGHAPETDNHFISVFTNDTNNQRRMRGLATVELNVATYPLNIEIGGRTYGVDLELLQELGAQAVTAGDRNWTATPMINLIEHFNISLDGIDEGMVISGGTGFTQPFTIDELLDYTNFFLAFEEDGIALEEQEGAGSNIMSLFAHDERATRRVRGVVTIRLLAAVEGVDVESTIEGLEDGEFAIIRGDTTWTITMDDLVAIGLEDFVTNIPTGGGSVRNFTGVRLTAILEAMDISVDGATNFITTSWESTFSAGWNIDADLSYIFIAVGEDGEPLSPHNGPFLGVVQDRGSNFNPRNLQSIRIN